MDENVCLSCIIFHLVPNFTPLDDVRPYGQLLYIGPLRCAWNGDTRVRSFRSFRTYDVPLLDSSSHGQRLFYHPMMSEDLPKADCEMPQKNSPRWGVGS